VAVRAAAIRALGRLEDPSLVPRMLPLVTGSTNEPEPAATTAIAQSLKGFDPSTNPELVSTVTARFVALANASDASMAFQRMTPLGRLNYSNEQQAKDAEKALLRLLDVTARDIKYGDARVAAARSFESLARLNVKLVRFDPETVRRLSDIVRHTSANDGPDARRNALAALIAGRALNDETELAAAKDDDEQVRRLAMTVLAGTGAGLDADRRAGLVTAGLADRSALVRFDALRAYIRRVAPAAGCDPILDALHDDSMHVVLAALDALGDLCQQDEGITIRLAAESRAPPMVGSWHREAHAFVSLAKRSPEKAAISMSAFVAHPVWEVRMYAARAAAAMNDAATLDRLSADPNDNVREATLAPLFKIKKADAVPMLISQLERRDYQLLRSTALLLKDAPSDHRLFAPLLEALTRVTKDRKDTSRDIRLALIEAMGVHGVATDLDTLEPFLKDFDSNVASAAATLASRWLGRPVLATPEHVSRGGEAPLSDESTCVAIALKKGQTMRIATLPAAPLTVHHFLTLALQDHYYDGLTFHRVVPGFVIQGGSPGANEYAGQKAFMRDEIGLATNTRGTVGISTRGRNTGDAQFFVNLVDNPRLDYDYTIFARVLDRDLPVLDSIVEGDGISHITRVDCR
jgi:cyclophilin family peptidyl-prolyl cis-trans isomerase/HEAT repeat protein